MTYPLERYTAINTVKLALSEDLGAGDVTSLSTVDPAMMALGRVVSKDSGIVCGLDVVRWVFEEICRDLHFVTPVTDGDAMKPGMLLAQVSAPARELLMGERVALNFLQRMSAISSLTSRFVQKVSHTKAVIVDTRKTTPGLRAFEKYAVRVGGGGNHRFCLSDAVLIKDNHIVAAGGIATAVSRARASVPHTAKIEVECETQAQVEEALVACADIIMLDNMSVDMMAQMVKLIDGRAIVEASGNITDDTVGAIAETGVDIISVGRLTRSAGSLDISLDLELAV